MVRAATDPGGPGRRSRTDDGRRPAGGGGERFPARAIAGGQRRDVAPGRRRAGTSGGAAALGRPARRGVICWCRSTFPPPPRRLHYLHTLAPGLVAFSMRFALLG